MAALDELYRRRALPAGSRRYLCWLFAAAPSRDAWFGIFALQAEWRALLHPATDPAVCAAKLAWWRDDVLRLTQGRGVHPICRFLEQLPGAAPADFQPLLAAIEAVAVQASGVPVERRADLAAHADALYGGPLRVAVALGAAGGRGAPGGFDPARHAPALHACTAATALGAYLGCALADHRGDARRGLIAFPVDELLAAGIETAELAAAQLTPRLQDYLARQAHAARGAFEQAAQALPVEARPALRGLLVLIDLERRHLEARADSRATAGAPPGEDNARLTDLWWAWRTARRAAHARFRMH